MYYLLFCFSAFPSSVIIAQKLVSTLSGQKQEFWLEVLLKYHFYQTNKISPLL